MKAVSVHADSCITYSYIYDHKFEHGKDALNMLIKENELDKPKFDKDGNDIYVIDEDDINRVYESIDANKMLTHLDKLNIIARRIFADADEFGPISSLYEYAVDEIDGGVSGIPSNAFDITSLAEDTDLRFSYDSIWIMHKGQNIHLKFLSFGSQDELIRVCQNLYKYKPSAYLSERKGYVLSTMKDGSRIVVVRPPFADSWGFFLRKFDTVKTARLEENIKGNNIIPITHLKWFTKGCLTQAITGTQGCGKSTLLKGEVEYVPKTFNIRVQESTAELNLRYLYADRNITSFQETPSISVQEGINIQKKTNGTVNIFGEVASGPEAVTMLQVTKVASRFTLFTHHAKTTRDLITALRDNTLQEGMFSDAKVAEENIANAINIDIHLEKNKKGERYIERITEIIPIRDRRYPSELPKNKNKALEELERLDHMEFMKRVTDRQTFETVDLVVYKNGDYVLVNDMSDGLKDIILRNLSEEEEEIFLKEMSDLKQRKDDESAAV